MVLDSMSFKKFLYKCKFIADKSKETFSFADQEATEFGGMV